MHRIVIVRTCGIAILLALASGVSAQEGSVSPLRDIHRLGGSTAFYKPALTDGASLTRLGRNARIAADLRTVLAQAGVAELTEPVTAVLSSATSTVGGGSCADATPAVNAIVECDMLPGQSLRWMAYRPTGGTSLDIMREVRWAGRRAVPAFLFRVTANSRTYTFLLPKICGNLTLMDERAVPVPLAAVAPGPVALVEPVAAPVAPPPAPAPVAVERAEPAESTLASAPQAASPVAGRAWPFFVDLLGGKDRRVRPIGDRTTIDGSSVRANVGSSGTEFAQCSPLLGVKVGVSKRWSNDWELAGAAGVAFSLVRADDKVRQHEVLVDVEANRYLRGVMLGSGLSLWDVTHSDTFQPAWLAHVGVPLGAGALPRAYFLVEGRVFFERFADPANNYQFWAGLRLHL